MDGLAEAVNQSRTFLRRSFLKLMAQCDKTHKCRNRQLWETEGKLGLNLRMSFIPSGSPERSTFPGAVKAAAVKSLLKGKLKIQALETRIKELVAVANESEARNLCLITSIKDLEESNGRLAEKIRVISLYRAF